MNLKSLCEIVTDEDGDLRYEWDFGKGNVFTVFVFKNGKGLGFAGLIDGKRIHGQMEKREEK